MPPKPKPLPEPRDQNPVEPQGTQAPKTINQRSASAYAQGNPYASSLQASGPSGLSASDRIVWTNAHFARHPALLKRLSNKSQRDVWKTFNEASGIPLRSVKFCNPISGRAASSSQNNSGERSVQQPAFDWGKDKFGADLGGYSPEAFAKRSETASKLAALEIQHKFFLEQRERERDKWISLDTKEPVVVTLDEVDQEKSRRKEIANLRMDLYGERTGAYSADPAWDDIVPMPVEDSPTALAAIAYPEDYAEAISYLRAVMANKEASTRCLHLTEHVISMNPAHYTVWLYRFFIVQAMKIPLASEIEWLNKVSLDNLKNYQIWHHRRLLIEQYYSEVESNPDEKARLFKSEQAFLSKTLVEDAKNYHVWSYRQYLVPKLAAFGEAEVQAAEALIDEDVRNNSAWSHRFFVVFSDPEYTTPGSLSTEYDPKVPAHIIDREVGYAQKKTLLAPQNQSPWNYLRGVLIKGQRNMVSVEDFTRQFVSDIGVEEKEKVTSTHALEMLADIHGEKGENDEADLCLRRLGEKWDRIRRGYWEWKRRVVDHGKAAA